MWRIVTFEFSSKGSSTSGTFAIEVDNSGVPITYGRRCVWENVSGDSVADCMFEAGTYIAFSTDAEAAGILSNFVSATENTTYTESSGDLTGTWSYTNASSISTTRIVTFEFTGKAAYAGVFSIDVNSFTGVPIQVSGNYVFESISGDGISSIHYDVDTDKLYIGNVTTSGTFSNFSSAVPDHTYTESEPTGTWSYVNKTYIITASASTGGSISPSGSVSVIDGLDQAFTITPDEGYYIASVLVDDVESISELVNNTYTFTNVNAVHTIEAIFGTIPPTPPFKGYGFNTSGMIDTDYLNEVSIKRN